MRYLPLFLLLGLLSCDRETLAPTLSYQVNETPVISQDVVPGDGLHSSIASSTWWQELSPAVRQFAGPELSNPNQPVTLHQLEARLQLAANQAVAKAGPSSCGGFPVANTAGDVTLNSQADVDAFGAMKCKDIIGALVIVDTLGPDPIVDLSPLSKLKSIGSSLTIDSDGLTDLTGLNKLKTIGLAGPFGFIGLNGNNLSDVSALSSLKTVTGSINIIDCDALVSVTSAFSQLKVIAPGQTPDSVLSVFTLNVSRNDLLTDISGFSGLTTMDRLMIETNGSLTDLDDLSSLNTIVDDIRVFENTALTNVNELSNITTIGRNLIVFDNPALTTCCGLFNLFCADAPACTTNNIGGLVLLENNGAGCTIADIVAGGACP